MPCSCDEADEAIYLGPAQVVDPATNHGKSTYVDYGMLERALRQARADAVWVGWGFVAEHAEFADFCRDMGIVFIGPDGDVMRRLGDKIIVEAFGGRRRRCRVAPWSSGPVETLRRRMGTRPSAWVIRYLSRPRREAEVTESAA